MPHFEIILDSSGAVETVVKDGKKFGKKVQLEQLYSSSAFYFKAAIENIRRMEQKENELFLEMLGVQSFLMSLTGLEAFTNSYFMLRAKEKFSDQLKEAINIKGGKLH